MCVPSYAADLAGRPSLFTCMYVYVSRFRTQCAHIPPSSIYHTSQTYVSRETDQGRQRYNISPSVYSIHHAGFWTRCPNVPPSSIHHTSNVRNRDLAIPISIYVTNAPNVASAWSCVRRRELTVRMPSLGKCLMRAVGGCGWV